MTTSGETTPMATQEPPAAEEPAAAEEPRTAEAPGADGSAATDRSGATAGPLVPEDATMDFRSRWEAVQQGFVDEPRAAVTDADRLVGDVLQRLSQTFEDQHRELEQQWAEGEPSTEDLRTALRRYRTFFERLLTL